MKIFVSSTISDLSHMREVLAKYIRDLGHQPILSEEGSVPYDRTIGIEDSCYDKVRQSDIYVLMVGSCYGSLSSEPGYERCSITRREYKAAVEQRIPIYVFVYEKVHAEFQTYRANRGRLSPTQVDSLDVYDFLGNL